MTPYRALYSLALYLLLPLQFWRLWRRGVELPAYRQRWRERLAFGPALPAGPRLWVHAVSVGEVNAAAPLIERLLAQSGTRLLVTTTTPTGSDTVLQRFGGRVDHVYFPYDLPGAIRRFLRRVQPAALVVMETELWPNCFHGCRQRGIPVVLVNARLSDKSLRGYRRLAALSRSTLACIDRIFAQDQADAERFVALGAERSRIEVIGNLKFDCRVADEAVRQGRALRRRWRAHSFVWIAASTHPGEEAQVIEAHRRVLAQIDDALLIIAPRHPDRFDAVARQCRDSGLSWARRTMADPVTEVTKIYLADTLGELDLLYAAADVAFVAGSFADIGGHNPLEPAACARPVLSGPVVRNFAQIYRRMTEAGAAQIVADPPALAQHLLALAADETARSEAGARALAFIQQNAGGVDTVTEYIHSIAGRD